MNKKQAAAVLAPPLLLISMVPLYQWLSRQLGETIGWYLGFFPYWFIWCGALPLWLMSGDSLRRLIRPQKPDRTIVFLLLVPLVGAGAYKLIPGMDFGQASIWPFIMIMSTVFGNGFFEEVLWRGVYMELFPRNLLLRIVWPTIWFALWHYAPGSVSSEGNVVALIVGSGIFGLYLSFLAWRTNTIWWSILAHTIGGLIMAL